MPKSTNIVHLYFKGRFEDSEILVRVNPLQWKGTELTRTAEGQLLIRELDFDEHIIDDLKHDGFVEASPLEFNLYLSGLAGTMP
jgi:hypothetical protein